MRHELFLRLALAVSPTPRFMGDVYSNEEAGLYVLVFWRATARALLDMYLVSLPSVLLTFFILTSIRLAVRLLAVIL